MTHYNSRHGMSTDKLCYQPEFYSLTNDQVEIVNVLIRETENEKYLHY